MKNFNQLITIMLAVFVLVFSSCSDDDDDDNNNGNGGDQYFTAKIDGADFEAAQTPAVIIGATSTNGVLAVQGGDNDGNTINISIINYTGVGTYTTGDNITNSNIAQYLEINPVAGWLSNGVTALVGGLTPGSIEITSDDGTTVMGTFSFDGYNGDDMTTKVITQGEFKANFTN